MTAVEKQLLENATRITTKEGHLLQKIGDVWYAYPKIDKSSPGDGGDAIMRDSEWKQLVQFETARDAYLACCVLAYDPIKLQIEIQDQTDVREQNDGQMIDSACAADYHAQCVCPKTCRCECHHENQRTE